MQGDTEVAGQIGMRRPYVCEEPVVGYSGGSAASGVSPPLLLKGPFASQGYRPLGSETVRRLTMAGIQFNHFMKALIGRVVHRKVEVVPRSSRLHSGTETSTCTAISKR